MIGCFPGGARNVMGVVIGLNCIGCRGGQRIDEVAGLAAGVAMHGDGMSLAASCFRGISCFKQDGDAVKIELGGCAVSVVGGAERLCKLCTRCRCSV